MAQLSDDCFAFGDELMTTAAALAALGARLGPVVEPQPAPLAGALGRYLAEDIVAARSVPPHDNSAVDGYAVRFEHLSADGTTVLAVAGRAAAGHPYEGTLQPGEAVRVFTGAPLPTGADTVLMQEDCSADGDQVTIPPGIKLGANARAAGEDVREGDTALTRGMRLRPQDVGLAASLGLKEVSVYRPLKVALFSTGDEIRDVGADLPPGCVYDANRYALAGLLSDGGCLVSDLGILPDERGAVRRALDEAATGHDLVMTSGGVSVGDEDHVRAAVTALGSIHFWRLAIRPGRPIAFGQIGAVPFIGLPGNPVAVMVTYLRFARPAIQLLSGGLAVPPRTYLVRASFGYSKKTSRREWLRVRVCAGPDGVLSVEKFPRDGAGILSSMVHADGLVELPEELARVEPGMMVDYLPFNEVR